MLNAAVQRGSLRGIEFGRERVSLTHFLFADDSLLFLEAAPEHCWELSSILGQCENVSGQKVNLSKSSLFFSKGVSEVCREEITAILGMPQGEGKWKYLGLPFMTGRSKKDIFAFVRERVIKKLSGWKEKILSPAGREVLIKSVVQAIPSYVMQCFLLPKTLIQELEVQIRRFFWGGSEGASKIHWKAWTTCCLSKRFGGLGFRDLEAFNRALLAKQSWRLLRAPSSLASRVLQAKYYTGSDILSVQLGSRPSYMRRSILEGRELLLQGVRWRVGDGHSICIYSDPWLPMEPHFRPVFGQYNLAQDAMVCDLLSADGHDWNGDIVKACFLDHEVDRILATPLAPSHQVDKIIWHYHAKGAYTMKSGYHLAMSCSQETLISAAPSSAPSMEACLWKTIWTSPILPRVQHFIWKVVHNCLPLAKNLRIRGLGERDCMLSGAPCEDLFHCFVDCAIPSAVYEKTEIMQRALDRQPTSMVDLLWSVHHEEGVEGFCMTANILWQVWKARCNALFDDKAVSVSGVLGMTEKQLEDHMLALSSLLQARSEPLWQTSWKKPANGYVKVNVDGALGQNTCSLGVIICDSGGVLLHAESRPIAHTSNVVAVELFALHAGLMVAFCMGFSHIELEGDSLTAFQKLTLEGEDLSLFGAVVESIRLLALCFTDVKFTFVKRTGSTPAHAFALHGLSLLVSTIWNHNIPPNVFLAIMADLS